MHDTDLSVLNVLKVLLQKSHPFGFLVLVLFALLYITLGQGDSIQFIYRHM